MQHPPPTTPHETITLDTLRQLLHRVDPSALLVEPRILRRVIRLDRRVAGLAFMVPHRKGYAIERDRLLVFVNRAEVELPPEAELPETVILLAKPKDDESLVLLGAAETLYRYWRLLFHARVHVALERRLAEYPPTDDLAALRRAQIGGTEFAEARAVLLKDGFLFPDPSDREVYVEFAAVYLELRYFAEEQLSLTFPAVRNWQDVDRIVSQDLDHAQLLESTRLEEAPQHVEHAPAAHGGTDATTASFPSASQCARLEARADRAAAAGNGVRAALLRTRAASLALPYQASEIHDSAHRELRLVILRLQRVLQLSDAETDAWQDAVRPLLLPGAGWFWSAEARLLNDLQRVCFEQERGVFKLDVMQWCRAATGSVIRRIRAQFKSVAAPPSGPPDERPIRRPLPLLREVLVARHLHKAHRRLARVRLPDAARQRLESLLGSAKQRVEGALRVRFRPLFDAALDEVGLVPQNVPERVARHKLVEQMIDRVIEHRYVTMGDLRDAISDGDLKLPDVSGLWELVRGDQLLRADRKLATTFEGVYRPGAIYLRWPQRISSVAFGSPLGRVLTKFIVLTYGSAYLAVAFVRVTIAEMSGLPTSEAVKKVKFTTRNATAVAVVGTLLLLLIHHARFRAGCVEMVRRCGRLLRGAFVDLPARLIRSPLVQQVLSSPLYLALRDYLLRPALVTALLWVGSLCVGRTWGAGVSTYVFLLFALFLNSPLGRFADEWATDLFARSLYELRMRVLATAFQWVMDVFHRLMVTVERIVFTVDDWLRYRAGDKRLAEGAKFVSGTVWFFASYLVLFAFTLLIEPQINPIKHFPVVTVSHKLMLLVGGIVITMLEPYLGKARATTLVVSTVWLIPGIFGFLVWELRANWRLYAANRPRTLVPLPVGHHGETMVRLLRPGFHSGRLPKLYAALRRAMRKARRSGNLQPMGRKQAALKDVAEAVRHFTQREFLALLVEVDFLPGATIQVGEIRTATNRLEIELQRADNPRHPAWLTWQEDAGRLVATLSHAGWIDSLSAGHRETFAAALSGVCQRTGVDVARGPLTLTVAPPMTWTDWVARWSVRSE